jgi:hypothetical protein
MSAPHGRPKGRHSTHEAAQRRTTVTPSLGGERGVSRSTAPCRASRPAVQSRQWERAGGRGVK